MLRTLFACRVVKFNKFFHYSTANSVLERHKIISSIDLTGSAVQRLTELAKNNSEKMLRISVEGGGCSGFQYLFNLDSKINEDDCIVEKDGARVIVDQDSLTYLEGATIDYQSELIRTAFRILKNPKADAACSCGTSFSLKVT